MWKGDSKESWYCYDKNITVRAETLNVTSWHSVEGKNLSMMHLSVVRQADKNTVSHRYFFLRGLQMIEESNGHLTNQPVTAITVVTAQAILFVFNQCRVKLLHLF